MHRARSSGAERLAVLVDVDEPLAATATRPAGRVGRDVTQPRHAATLPRARRRRYVAEVLEVPARRRAALALVLRPGGALAVRRVGRRGHLHEADLADLHPRVQRDRQAGHVGQLERDVPVETGIDEAGRAVDQQPEAAERRVVRRDERAPGEVDAVDGVDLDAAHGNRRDRPDVDDRAESRNRTRRCDARTTGRERDVVRRAVIDAVHHRRLLGDHRSEPRLQTSSWTCSARCSVDRRELAPVPIGRSRRRSPSAPRATTIAAGPMPAGSRRDVLDALVEVPSPSRIPSTYGSIGSARAGHCTLPVEVDVMVVFAAARAAWRRSRAVVFTDGGACRRRSALLVVSHSCDSSAIDRRSVGEGDLVARPTEHDLRDVLDADRLTGVAEDRVADARSRPSSSTRRASGSGWRSTSALPSIRATRSSGTATRSSVEPSTNSPGWSMNTPSSAISTSSVSAVRSCLTSMTPAVWLRNTRNSRSRRTSTDDGCTSSSSNGSMTMRPAASCSRIVRSDRITAAP